MRAFQVVAVGLIGIATLACGSEPGAVPTHPAPVAVQPPPQPPPPPPATARRIELRSVVREQLRVSQTPAGCPPTAIPGILLPCRHFEVIAPGDGVLRVEVDWIPQSGAEAVMLIVAGRNNPDARVGVNPQVATQRVLANATYGITLSYWPSHYDYLFGGADLIGEFKLEAGFER